MAAIFWIFPALDSLPLPSTGKVGVGEGSEGVGSIALKVSTAHFNLEEGEGGKRTSRPPPPPPPSFQNCVRKNPRFCEKKKTKWPIFGLFSPDGSPESPTHLGDETCYVMGTWAYGGERERARARPTLLDPGRSRASLLPSQPPPVEGVHCARCTFFKICCHRFTRIYLWSRPYKPQTER